jgi:hypothetical protein
MFLSKSLDDRIRFLSLIGTAFRELTVLAERKCQELKEPSKRQETFITGLLGTRPVI